MARAQRGKRRASRSPSPGSADPPEPYETIVLRHFREQLDEEYEDTPAERRNIIEAVAEEVEEFSVSAVSRRQALPPITLRPTAAPANEAEIEDRRNTLRDHIRVPHGIAVENLDRLLHRTGWNVIRAAALFRREEQVARLTNPSAPLFPGLPPRRPTNLGVNQNRGHGRASVPESRRAALAALYVNMQQAGAPTTETNHTVARFLRRHGWDFRAALQDYLSPQGANRDLRAYRGAMLRSSNATQYQEDERLAELLNLVSIDSVHSARHLLQRFNFDVSRAYDEYVRLGRVPYLRVQRPRRGRRAPIVDMREVSVEYGPDNTRLDVHSWARLLPDVDGYVEELTPDYSVTDPNPHFSFTSTPQPGNVADPPDYERGDKHIIDPIPRGYRPRVNCPNPIFLRIESLSRGKYKIARKEPGTKKTRGEPEFLRWDDDPRAKTSRYRDFDWRSPRDIATLNKSVTQESLRAGQKTKEKPLGWHELEKDFLWMEYVKVTEKLAERLGKKRLTSRDLPPRLSEATKQRIAAEMNARFEGKQIVDGVDMGVPRPHRTSKSINTARGRIPEIMHDFNTGFQDPHRSRREKAAKAPAPSRPTVGSEYTDSETPELESSGIGGNFDEGDEEQSEIEERAESEEGSEYIPRTPHGESLLDVEGEVGDEGLTYLDRELVGRPRRVPRRPSYVFYSDKGTQTSPPRSPRSSSQGSPE